MTCKIDLNKIALRQCLLYDCLSGLSAAESTRRICAAFGQSVIYESTGQLWFSGFKYENYSLEDEPRSGRFSEVDDEQLRSVVETDPGKVPAT